MQPLRNVKMSLKPTKHPISMTELLTKLIKIDYHISSQAGVALEGPKHGRRDDCPRHHFF